MQRHRDFSESTAQEIDEELRFVVTECFERAKSLLLGSIDALHGIATALLEKEVLDGLEIEAIMVEQINGVEESIQG
jgi:cell division protease FtsH